MTLVEKQVLGAGIVVQPVEPPLRMPTSHISALPSPRYFRSGFLLVLFGRQQVTDGSGAWADQDGRPKQSSGLLAPAWLNPECYRHLGSAPVNERCVFLSLCLKIN